MHFACLIALAVAGAALLVLGYVLGRRHPELLARLRPERPAPVARVALESVGLTAGGSMVIVRYRVLRPGRLDVGPDRFRVIDEDSGHHMSVLRLARAGAIAVTEASRNASGYLLVGNRDDRVKRGSRLTVLLGGRTYQHLGVA